MHFRDALLKALSLPQQACCAFGKGTGKNMSESMEDDIAHRCLECNGERSECKRCSACFCKWCDLPDLDFPSKYGGMVCKQCEIKCREERILKKGVFMYPMEDAGKEGDPLRAESVRPSGCLVAKVSKDNRREGGSSRNRKNNNASTRSRKDGGEKGPPSPPARYISPDEHNGALVHWEDEGPPSPPLRSMSPKVHSKSPHSDNLRRTDSLPANQQASGCTSLEPNPLNYTKDDQAREHSSQNMFTSSMLEKQSTTVAPRLLAGGAQYKTTCENTRGLIASPKSLASKSDSPMSNKVPRLDTSALSSANTPKAEKNTARTDVAVRGGSDAMDTSRVLDTTRTANQHSPTESSCGFSPAIQAHLDSLHSSVLGSVH